MKTKENTGTYEYNKRKWGRTQNKINVDDKKPSTSFSMSPPLCLDDLSLLRIHLLNFLAPGLVPRSFVLPPQADKTVHMNLE